MMTNIRRRNNYKKGKKRKKLISMIFFRQFYVIWWKLYVEFSFFVMWPVHWMKNLEIRIWLPFQWYYTLILSYEIVTSYKVHYSTTFMLYFAIQTTILSLIFWNVSYTLKRVLHILNQLKGNMTKMKLTFITWPKFDEKVWSNTSTMV